MSEPEQATGLAMMRRGGLVLLMIGFGQAALSVASLGDGTSFWWMLDALTLFAGALVYRGNALATRLTVWGLSLVVGAIMFAPLPLATLSLLTPAIWAAPKIATSGWLLVGLSWGALLSLLIWLRQSLASVPVFEGGGPAPGLLRSRAMAVGAAIPFVLAVFEAVLIAGLPR